MAQSLSLAFPAEAGERPRARESAGKAAIEEDDFPFEKFCDVAELESWRKEVNRPLYHIHKWWARRLGSVFRAIVLGTLTPAGTDIKQGFYQPLRFPRAVVFDPFMGSGTTVGEAVKFGCRVIGRDINPVAHFIVKNALARHSRTQILEEYSAIQRDVAAKIQHFYRGNLNGSEVQCLYYFWVKVLDCPQCGKAVDLFNSYVFARHADTARFPAVQAVCPSCGAVNQLRHDAEQAECGTCGVSYEPKKGPANGSKAACPHCRHVFPVAKTARAAGCPPEHRLYAKLVVAETGEKKYLAADDYDRALYEEAVAALEARERDFPDVGLRAGHNTNQAINYGYRRWREMFNARQLVCLGILGDRIRAIQSEPLRDLFICLFSGVLEFNNMFSSYKGEGTGAVRHMFAHHVLKPERTPLEANLWGTPKSSGSFSTLFKSRLIRFLDYCEDPFEISATRKNGRLTSEKVFGLSEPIGYPIAEDFRAFQSGCRVYLSCGDSSETDLADNAVDAVITDPPFFDNVHYSQLADFFHVWQEYLRPSSASKSETTRSEREVQQTDARVFTARLSAVWRECHRVLKTGGLMVFTYHHSRPEGWHSVFDAVTQGGFVIVAAHPIKAEMSVAMPKNQAKEPIDLDIIMVCRKREDYPVQRRTPESAWMQAIRLAGEQASRLRRAGRHLSRNDVRVVVMAQVIRFLSTGVEPRIAGAFLKRQQGRIDDVVDSFSVNPAPGSAARSARA